MNHENDFVKSKLAGESWIAEWLRTTIALNLANLENESVRNPRRAVILERDDDLKEGEHFFIWRGH